jgi:hypothetical protein
MTRCIYCLGSGHTGITFSENNDSIPVVCNICNGKGDITLEGTTLKKVLTQFGYDWAARSLDKPDSFMYWGDLDLFNTVGQVYGIHRDSDLLNQSNWEVVHTMIAAAGLSESFPEYTSNHWAVGWVTALCINLTTESGELNTPAIEFWAAIRESLENYPVLDDEHYSNLEYADLVQTIENCYKWDIERAAGDTEINLPDDWAYAIAGHLDNISSSDELTTEDVINAARVLGYIPMESEDKE